MFNKSYGIYRIVCDADKFANYNENAHVQLLEWMDEHIAETNDIGTKVAKGYVFNEVRTFINRDTAEYGIFIDYNNTRDINNFEGAIQKFVAWAVENGHIVSFEPVFSTVVHDCACYFISTGFFIEFLPRWLARLCFSIPQ